MINESVPGLRYLDHCIEDAEGLSRLSKALDKIAKCCLAVKQKINIADVLRDPENSESIRKAFEGDSYAQGMQLLLKLALNGYVRRSFTTWFDISDKKHFDFLFKCVGSWRQFDAVVVFDIPYAYSEDSIVVINPTRSPHWAKLQELPSKTVVTVYLRAADKGNVMQQSLALDRYEAAFEMVQDQARSGVTPAGGLELNSIGPKTPTVRRIENSGRRRSQEPAKLSYSLKVVISKTDVFVHAGNAQLVMSHLRNFPGKVVLSVNRGTRKQVQLDVDSIWAAELRNGETIVFDFFGPKPSEAFVKELAKKVNKYTQMDKLVNE